VWFAGLKALISTGRHNKLTGSELSYVSFNKNPSNDYLT
jgi:hypothetical protein